MQGLRFAVTLFMCSLAQCASGQENPRHIKLDPGDSVVTLQQNWTHEEANRFYNAPQGSRLLPYNWFIKLEQPDSTQPFIDADHVRRLGYIARDASADNPDGLPVGFVKDASYPDGVEGLGVTCAACHTGQIRSGGVTYLIDGAPTMGDMARLMKRLVDALNLTATDDVKFNRFAGSVLPTAAPEAMKRDLRSALTSVAKQRESYNDRNFPQETNHRFGHGRIDAFGAIFNEVSAKFVGIPGNAKPANAPVSYPCLWDAPQHDRVQWNGAAENRTSLLGIPLFGTAEVGALGRNAGEVLGVFGHVEINEMELLLPRRYASTVNKTQLLEIENSLKTLWSPEWPAAFGAIDQTRRARGEQLYRDNCLACHQLIDRDAPDRKVEAKLSDVDTDPQMLINFGRIARTGKLEGRRKTLTGLERFGPEEPVGAILKHVVERAILKDINANELASSLAVNVNETPAQDNNEFNPGYQSTAIVKRGGKESRIALESLKPTDGKLRIAASKSDLLELARNLASDDAVGLESLATADSVVRLDSSVDIESTPVGELEDATASLGYKARPLNGIWATSPYLHNGSVPNLMELLKPANQRSSEFHVGSVEFDPVNVGFTNDAAYPLFDTTVQGNSKSGHEYGAALDPEERLDLIEYLKSL